MNVHFCSASDINECDTANGFCDQICTNTEGSYTCGCNEGYRLGSDGMMCNGKLRSDTSNEFTLTLN